MLSLEEREWLMKDVSPHLSGFTPRPNQKLSCQKRPREMLDIECRHFLRNPLESVVHQHPPVEYQMWVEAGKHDPPFPKRPDVSYNSNVWRNFRRNYGIQTSAEGRKVSEVIATLYPLNIPPPSQVGNNTFEKYIKETSLIKNEKYKIIAINQTKSDTEEFQRLKHKTEARNPPLDALGNILPPENYKRYVQQFVPLATPPPTPPPIGLKTDMFGQRYIPRSQPHLWKLTYKLNHPEYKHLQEEIKRRRQQMAQQQNQHLKVSRVLPSPVGFENLSK